MTSTITGKTIDTTPTAQELAELEAGKGTGGRLTAQQLADYANDPTVHQEYPSGMIITTKGYVVIGVSVAVLIIGGIWYFKYR